MKTRLIITMIFVAIGNVSELRSQDFCLVESASALHSHEDHTGWENKTGEYADVVIPVAFHVIYQNGESDPTNVSEDELDDQISVLNDAFDGSSFSFYKAVVSRTRDDVLGVKGFSLGIPTTYSWLSVDVPHVINVFVVESSGGTGDAGYSSTPDDYVEDDIRRLTTGHRLNLRSSTF